MCGELIIIFSFVMIVMLYVILYPGAFCACPFHCSLDKRLLVSLILNAFHLHVIILFLCFPCQSCIARNISLPCTIGTCQGFFILGNLPFGLAIILHEADVTRTHIRTAATFNTIKQMIFPQAIVVLGACVPVKLLWQ